MREYSSKCCIEPCAVSQEQVCFFPEIIGDYCKLQQRHWCAVTKNKRILQLATPKHQNEKYRSACICPDVALRKVEVVCKELPTNTRTQLLSYPQVSRLVSLKKHPAYKTFNVRRRSTVNRLLRKSLLSLYSRLSNVQPPEPPKLSKRWKSAEWVFRMKRIDKLAKSKAEKENEKRGSEPQKRKPAGKYFMPRKNENLQKMRRIKKLSKPKKYEEPQTREWHFTKGMRVFEPSERLKKLAKPRKITFAKSKRSEVFPVHSDALTYKPTIRIQQLAIPSRYFVKAETRENPYKTSANALKANASKRVKELAEPKDFAETHTRLHPYRVSPKALKAKITKRLIELSKPRTY